MNIALYWLQLCYNSWQKKKKHSTQLQLNVQRDKIKKHFLEEKKNQFCRCFVDETQSHGGEKKNTFDKRLFLLDLLLIFFSNLAVDFLKENTSEC